MPSDVTEQVDSHSLASTPRYHHQTSSLIQFPCFPLWIVLLLYQVQDKLYVVLLWLLERHGKLSCCFFMFADSSVYLLSSAYWFPTTIHNLLFPCRSTMSRLAIGAAGCIGLQRRNNFWTKWTLFRKVRINPGKGINGSSLDIPITSAKDRRQFSHRPASWCSWK